MRALIDGDVVAYRVGYTTNDLPYGIARARCDILVDRIIQETKSDRFNIYLSDSEGNFRKELYPQYKANRVQPKPKWIEELKEHLIVNWGASIALGQEADDALGIEQSNSENTIICSIDKDLLQIPGSHFNFVKGVISEVSQVEGIRHFYSQILIGDRIDNIEGVRGIGPKRAEKLLGTLSGEEEMFSVVRKIYSNDDALLLTGRLIKIRTKENELWNFPSLKQQQ